MTPSASYDLYVATIDDLMQCSTVHIAMIDRKSGWSEWRKAPARQASYTISNEPSACFTSLFAFTLCASTVMPHLSVASGALFVIFCQQLTMTKHSKASFAIRAHEFAMLTSEPPATTEPDCSRANASSL